MTRRSTVCPGKTTGKQSGPRLTARQRQALRQVDAFERREGYPPHVSEVWASYSTLHRLCLLGLLGAPDSYPSDKRRWPLTKAGRKALLDDSRPEPSAKQMELLRYVQQYTDAHGYPPSQMEVAGVLGVWKRAVECRAKRCRDLGLIDWVPWRARSMVLTDAGREALRRQP